MLNFLPALPELAPKFYEYRQDPVTQQFNPIRPSSLEAVRARLEKASSDWAEFHRAESYFWFVEEAGAVVGNVTIQSINHMMLTAEVGYGVFAQARGRGLGSAMVAKLCAEVFAHTNF